VREAGTAAYRPSLAEPRLSAA
ncbi:MAG: hypothetical protein JWR10_1380, partial [Rubritepida sp.]|nr:hypothetical protein [Rubritepida sp.]